MHSSTKEAHNSAHPCHSFSLADIQSATKNFDDELIIGRGGFGKVYKGQISIKDVGRVVAIKRSDSRSSQGAPEFWAEIEMLSMLRHCHLVSLIGYCDENSEMILVYEYMPHGTLYDHIHKAEKEHLSWVQRLKIAIGAGRGLDYLHTGVGTQHGVIHRDVKSSNILLDENWSAMISDFGLSKIGQTNLSFSYCVASVKGTFGYLDPDYFYTGKVTRKTDVYAFGVVLFELLSGRLAVDESKDEEDCSLVRWVQKCMKERKLNRMIDSNISGTVSPKCLKGFAHIAYRCLLGVPKQRPTMTEVVASLQTILNLQEEFDSCAKSSKTSGFTWKFHKYIVSGNKNNYDQSDTSSPNNLEDNMKQCSLIDEDYQCGKTVAGDLIMFTYLQLERLRADRYEDLEKLQLDLEMLKEFRHPNIVSLMRYSLDHKQLFLEYEFTRNGNFEDHLESGAIKRLPLARKVKIAIGIARGIRFLHDTQDELKGYPWEFKGYPWKEDILSNSLLERRKILLDEDFTAKLLGYDITKLLYGYTSVFDVDVDDFDDFDCYPGYEPLKLRKNFEGFKVVFAELLTGTPIPNSATFQKIDLWMRKYGKKPLNDIADVCFRSCNAVDSESKMLTILDEYTDQYYKH